MPPTEILGSLKKHLKLEQMEGTGCGVGPLWGGSLNEVPSPKVMVMSGNRPSLGLEVREYLLLAQYSPSGGFSKGLALPCLQPPLHNEG